MCYVSNVSAAITIIRTQEVQGLMHFSIIDHTYTKSKDRVTSAQVLPMGSSDHMGIVVQKIIQTTNKTTNPNIEVIIHQ